MSQPEKILIIRLKSIGDVVLTLPGVHAVRKNFPDAHITYLVCKSIAPLLEGFGDINAVIAVDRAALRNPLKALPVLVSLLRRLRSEKFSLVIDFHGYGETALMAWFSGAPKRWGSVYRKSRKWAYTHGAWRNDNFHMAAWNLEMLRQCGLETSNPQNQLVVPPAALEAAKALYGENKLDPEKPTLYIMPFTSALEKNWPLEKYLSVAGHWRSRGVQIVFGGGPADLPALERVREQGFAVIAAAPFLVTAGIMQLSTLVLGGDTGILHLGIATGKHALMLIKHCSPGRADPFLHKDWAIDPTGFDSFADIPVETVIGKCAEALSV